METKEKMTGMYRKMYQIRKYEERIYYLFLEGAMPGTIHQSHGQEACAVGMLYDLSDKDYCVSTHRPAGHSLAKGVPLKDMMAEMFAKSTGCCGGYGGAMHTGDISRGMPPAIAIVGGGVPLAAGIALSCKMRKTDNVCVAFLGDGATNEGSVHETMNGAAIWKLPMIFAIENNLYGASTPISLTTNIKDLAERGAAYGIPSEVVDGMDVLAVNEAAARAIARARRGEGPTILELKTYRIGGHSRNDACGYRTREEEAEWAKRDAIKNMRNYLLENGIMTEAELTGLEKAVEDEIEEAVAYAQQQPSPKPEDALKYAYVEEGIL